MKSPPDVEPSDDGENDRADMFAKAKQLPQKLDKKEGKKELEKEDRGKEEFGEAGRPGGTDQGGKRAGERAHRPERITRAKKEARRRCQGGRQGLRQAEAKEGSKEGATTVGHGKGGGRGRETTLDGDGEKDIQKMQSDVAVEARTIEQTMGRIAGPEGGRPLEVGDADERGRAKSRRGERGLRSGKPRPSGRIGT